jgi:hypothetical protein
MQATGLAGRWVSFSRVGADAGSPGTWERQQPHVREFNDLMGFFSVLDVTPAEAWNATMSSMSRGRPAIARVCVLVQQLSACGVEFCIRIQPFDRMAHLCRIRAENPGTLTVKLMLCPAIAGQVSLEKQPRRQSSHCSCRWRNESATRYFPSRRWAARPRREPITNPCCFPPGPHHPSTAPRRIH